ncbi:Uncharacterised protein [Mycobacteroides abscessus subsp. abscessus]|nr:Uncharacterised protein [Mycobacteroides abscessus subsp. abscessus]SLE84424.1 Uncharacterised protein [Mycobacteroides abscessus subsp. abscessus]
MTARVGGQFQAGAPVPAPVAGESRVQFLVLQQFNSCWCRYADRQVREPVGGCDHILQAWVGVLEQEYTDRDPGTGPPVGGERFHEPGQLHIGYGVLSGQPGDPVPRYTTGVLKIGGFTAVGCGATQHRSGCGSHREHRGAAGGK